MIFGILTFIMLFLSSYVKDRKVALNCQSLSCLFESIYGFIVGALTGAVLSFINFIRSLLFCHKEKFNKDLYFLLLILFETLVCVNCVFTWQGMISFLPTNGAYYACFNGVFLVFGYVLLFVISFVSFLEKDVKIFDNLNKKYCYNFVSDRGDGK